MSDFNVTIAPVQKVKAVVVSGPTGPQGNQGPAGPATTDASLMTSGTLPDARLSANVVKVSDLLSATTAEDLLLPTTPPSAPFQPWIEEPGNYKRYTARTLFSGDVLNAHGQIYAGYAVNA